jgi:hypothetical protein
LKPYVCISLCGLNPLARKSLPSNPDLIKQCLYSIGDNHAFLRVNRDPCDNLIKLLKRMVDPVTPEPNFSLAIRAGVGGARLSHGHDRQYQYVMQSLSLWREIQHDFFRLWFGCEEDLLSTVNPYRFAFLVDLIYQNRLRDTGQGLNRIQHSPRTSRLMHQILSSAQSRVGSWVGSSVIHLGDHNVPNSLMLIDKYTQVYRILAPLWTCLTSLQAVCEGDAGVEEYVQNSFGGHEMAIKIIACDFFKVCIPITLTS